MKKRILIDASTVTSQIDGLSHYIINLIKYLPEASFEKFVVGEWAGAGHSNGKNKTTAQYDVERRSEIARG